MFGVSAEGCLFFLLRQQKKVWFFSALSAILAVRRIKAQIHRRARRDRRVDIHQGAAQRYFFYWFLFYLAQPAYYLFFSAISAISAVNKNKNSIHSFNF